MKNLTPAELAAVGAVDRDRIAADLAAVVAHPSLTGSEGEVQTEMALRMTTAGLEVERVDVAAADLASDPVRLGCATMAARSAAMRSRSTAPTAASSAGVRFFIPAGWGG